MNLIDPLTARFKNTAGGALSLKLVGDNYFDDVFCIQLFPVSHPGAFVSVCRKNGTDTIEIGIIETVAALDPSQQALVNADIRFRYFVPEILDVVKISGRRGVDTWEVSTDRGSKTFTVQDRKENVTLTDSGIVFVVDVDKCRYKIPDFRKLPPKAVSLVEKNLL